MDTSYLLPPGPGPGPGPRPGPGRSAGGSMRGAGALRAADLLLPLYGSYELVIGTRAGNGQYLQEGTGSDPRAAPTLGPAPARAGVLSWSSSRPLNVNMSGS